MEPELNLMSLRFQRVFSGGWSLPRPSAHLFYPSFSLTVYLAVVMPVGWGDLAVSLGLGWAVKSHRCTTSFLRLKPTISPLVFVLWFRVCFMVWSTGSHVRTCAVHQSLLWTACNHRGGYPEEPTCQEDTQVNTLHNKSGHMWKITVV